MLTHIVIAGCQSTLCPLEPTALQTAALILGSPWALTAEFLGTLKGDEAHVIL